jgi:pantothenate kinase
MYCLVGLAFIKRTPFLLIWVLPITLKIIHLPKIPYRYIVGLAGPPGSGKSTLANEVARRVNKLWPQKASSLDSQVTPPDVAMVLPMDGFHLYRSQLDKMEVSLSF